MISLVPHSHPEPHLLFILNSEGGLFEKPVRKEDTNREPRVLLDVDVLRVDITTSWPKLIVGINTDSRICALKEVIVII